MEIYYYNHCEFKDLPWISDRAKELADMVRNSDRADVLWKQIEKDVMSAIEADCISFTIYDPTGSTDYNNLKWLEENFCEICEKYFSQQK